MGVYARGLCRNCYALAWRLVRERLTTWESLEARRKTLPPPQHSRTKTKWFLEEKVPDLQDDVDKTSE